jgi:23S rRNA-intervening sequence protein
MKVKNYQELIVWQRAMDLVEEVYTASKSFPREEMYGLTSQLRRLLFQFPRMSQRDKVGVQLLTSCAIYQ